MKTQLNIFGYGDAGPNWNWIVPLWDDIETDWSFFSTSRGTLLASVPGPHWGRVRAALRLNIAGRWMKPDLLISMGPVNTFYTEALGQCLRRRSPHLGWAFNFTDLPQGRQRSMLSHGLRQVERFIVFSRMEQALYARYFDLPEERFHFTHWGATAPLSSPTQRSIASRYVAALGGEARDYVTLCEAARRLPHVRFVVIARPHSLEGQAVPGNMEVRTNLPWDEAWSLVAHAELAVIPLLTSETPNGHVTVVGGMHLGKAQVVTASAGIADYAQDGDTAMLVPPRDGRAMAQAIERLIDEPTLRGSLGARAQTFAATHCSEQVTINFARQQIREMLGV